MEINIPLPNSVSINTYKELKSYLKQLELCIHHAQKAVENAEENNVELSDDAFVCFDHPSLEEKQKDERYDELQNVVLQINLS